MCLTLSSLATQGLISGIKCNEPPPVTDKKKQERDPPSYFSLSIYFQSLFAHSEVKTFHCVATSCFDWWRKRWTLPSKCTSTSHPNTLSNLDHSQDLLFSPFCGLKKASVAMAVMHILPCRNGKVVGVSWQRTWVLPQIKLNIAWWRSAECRSWKMGRSPLKELWLPVSRAAKP